MHVTHKGLHLEPFMVVRPGTKPELEDGIISQLKKYITFSILLYYPYFLLFPY